MNKEIEEIIEYFRNDIKWLEEELKNPHYLGNYITIRDKEYEYLKQLLDYITNLQEENERLNNQYDLMENSLDEKQEVIDKAIEYCEEITSREIDISDTDYDLGQDFTARDILNILRGENNE